MKKIKFALMLMESGLTQKQICDKLGWRYEKLTRFVHGQRSPNTDDVGELALVLGKTIKEINDALSWRPEIPKVHRTCPWCSNMIEIIAEDNIVDTWNNVPERCHVCNKPIEIMTDESDVTGDIFWWFTRSE